MFVVVSSGFAFGLLTRLLCLLAFVGWLRLIVQAYWLFYCCLLYCVFTLGYALYVLVEYFLEVLFGCLYVISVLCLF